MPELRFQHKNYLGVFNANTHALATLPILILPDLGQGHGEV